jgi:hypothetical protein
MDRETVSKVVVVVTVTGLGALIGAGMLRVDGAQSDSLALSDANGPILGCGVAVDQVCPSCRASEPADTACSCYDSLHGGGRQDCACRNSTGGIQTGQIITCETGRFTWREQHPGKDIRQGGSISCSTTKECRAGYGGCANPPPCPGSCGWLATQHGLALEYVEGDACQ